MGVGGGDGAAEGGFGGFLFGPEEAVHGGLVQTWNGSCTGWFTMLSRASKLSMVLMYLESARVFAYNDGSGRYHTYAKPAPLG